MVGIVNTVTDRTCDRGAGRAKLNHLEFNDNPLIATRGSRQVNLRYFSGGYPIRCNVTLDACGEGSISSSLLVGVVFGERLNLLEASEFISQIATGAGERTRTYASRRRALQGVQLS